mmetsp:Transcript_36654/g.92164  ORF Transcript_36654/g.92164 Transcript_36654/m.92164 type:complete len:389 (+) Transcript_36654:329-1495(+)
MFAAMAAATGGAEELTEARGKLRAAEEELERVNTGGDAQLIAEAKLGVAKVELGVAKAELGVAKAELGVAEAKWQAAPPEDKAVLQGSVLTAQKSVESAQHTVNSANMAYQNALRAAAPPHGKELGHDSVSSDLESAFEEKARTKLKVVLWNMFMDRAFAKADNDYIFARTLDPGNEEFDFLSHLRVSQDIQIRERPNEHDFQVVHGNLDLWLEQLKKKVEGGVEDGAQEMRLTPTKEESCESGATHYIVCETKVSRAKKSVLQRLQQLERKVGYLARRAYGDEPVDVGSCVALAGIGAPRCGAVTFQNVSNVLNSNQKDLPLLSELNKSYRLFLVFVETTADRLQILEEEQQRMQEEQRRAQEEQRHMLEEMLTRLDKLSTKMYELQ